MKDFPTHTIAAIFAVVALGGQAYIMSQASRYGNVTVIEVGEDGSKLDLQSYFFWLALGVTVTSVYNLILAYLAILKYSRPNLKKGVFAWLPLVVVLFLVKGFTAGILPELVGTRQASGSAVFILLTLYFQCVLWALVLAWRDVEIEEPRDDLPGE